MSERNENRTSLGLGRLPTHLHFGVDQRRSIAEVVRATGQRVLICTDHRMAASEHYAQIVADLEEAGVAASTFSAVTPDLPRTDVEALVAEFGGEQFDAIIGLGGGSCLDMAKVASVVLAHGGRLGDYYGEFNVPGPTIPIITVPTTAGTGAEATCIGVVHEPDMGVKVGVASPHLIPHAAIVDPVLTLSCPPGLTAAAGADALSHLVEAFTALAKNPDARDLHSYVYVGKNRIADAFVAAGVGLISTSLVTSYQEPDNLQARTDTMLAALYAGLAINTTGTAGAHALQSPIGALTGTAHGVGIAVLLPAVMRYNLPTRVPEFAQLGQFLGAADAGADLLTQARAAITRIEEILDALHLPRDLRALGMDRSDIQGVAEQAMKATRLLANNPRPLDLEAAELVITKAFEGDRTWWS